MQGRASETWFASSRRRCGMQCCAARERLRMRCQCCPRPHKAQQKTRCPVEPLLWTSWATNGHRWSTVRQDQGGRLHVATTRLAQAHRHAAKADQCARARIPSSHSAQPLPLFGWPRDPMGKTQGMMGSTGRLKSCVPVHPALQSAPSACLLDSYDGAAQLVALSRQGRS